MPEKVLSNIQVFNSHFIDNVKDPCIDKTNEKSSSVIHVYNDKKKNLVLMYLPKIPRVSQDIGFYLTAII